MARTPSDPPVARRALPCGGGKGEKGHPVVPPQGNVPKGFADFGQTPQVVMLMHQSLIALFFGSPDRAHKNLSKIQSRPPPRGVVKADFILDCDGLTRVNRNPVI